MASVYFCNGTPDEIAVNLNGALDNALVGARSTTDAGDAVKLPSHVFSVSKEPSAGTMGETGTNRILILLNVAPESVRFDVEIDSSLEGLDLYFFFMGNTLVGQDEQGRSVGISIKALETVKKQIQTGEEAAVVRLSPDALDTLEAPGAPAG